MKFDKDGFVNAINDRSLNMSNLSLPTLWKLFEDIQKAGIILLDKEKLQERCSDCAKEYRGKNWTPCELDDYCNKISIKEILKENET